MRSKFRHSLGMLKTYQSKLAAGDPASQPDQSSEAPPAAADPHETTAQETAAQATTAQETTTQAATAQETTTQATTAQEMATAQATTTVRESRAQTMQKLRVRFPCAASACDCRRHPDCPSAGVSQGCVECADESSEAAAAPAAGGDSLARESCSDDDVSNGPSARAGGNTLRASVDDDAAAAAGAAEALTALAAHAQAHVQAHAQAHVQAQAHVHVQAHVAARQPAYEVAVQQAQRAALAMSLPDRTPPEPHSAACELQPPVLPPQPSPQPPSRAAQSSQGSPSLRRAPREPQTAGGLPDGDGSHARVDSSVPVVDGRQHTVAAGPPPSAHPQAAALSSSLPACPPALAAPLAPATQRYSTGGSGCGAAASHIVPGHAAQDALDASSVRGQLAAGRLQWAERMWSVTEETFGPKRPSVVASERADRSAHQHVVGGTEGDLHIGDREHHALPAAVPTSVLSRAAGWTPHSAGPWHPGQPAQPTPPAVVAPPPQQPAHVPTGGSGRMPLPRRRGHVAPPSSAPTVELSCLGLPSAGPEETLSLRRPPTPSDGLPPKPQSVPPPAPRSSKAPVQHVGISGVSSHAQSPELALMPSDRRPGLPAVNASTPAAQVVASATAAAYAFAASAAGASFRPGLAGPSAEMPATPAARVTFGPRPATIDVTPVRASGRAVPVANRQPAGGSIEQVEDEEDVGGLLDLVEELDASPNLSELNEDEEADPTDDTTEFLMDETDELLTLLDSMAEVGYAECARLDPPSQLAHHPDLNCPQPSRGFQPGGSKRGAGVRAPLASLCRDHGGSHATKDAGAIDAAIHGKSEAAALEYLRHRIDMRVRQ